ncbi:MAG: nucleotide pyrophosphohydrolase [Burkholderiales bacterium]|nr:nucleotide pyrophosphohydrolase [Rhodocyclaceae bacterium]MCA3023346.1 nucleotide pyrophosphohydrolase [Rhodocyclaceae bacterium]MCA3054462.1 nucleotide pyrophosphohydrolase [Rhodocyclaceae bacterium]
MADLNTLRDQLRTFAAERDWDQFHSPKNLASALAVEAAELLEKFQWLTEAESRNLPPETIEGVRQEVADVLLYLIRISDKLGIDLIAAAKAKMALNARKYPVALSRGTSRKYDEV